MATVTELDGLFKTVYIKQKDATRVRPEFALLQKLVPMDGKYKVGREFAVPVSLTDEVGFSFIGETDAEIDLELPAGGETQQAKVKATDILLQASLSYRALSQTAAGDTAAFELATQHKVKNSVASASCQLEMELLYGQDGLATLASVGTVAAGKLDVVVTDATWAVGFWQAKKGLRLDVYNSSTLINTNAVVTLDKVNLATKTITLAGNSTDLGNIAAGHKLFNRNQFGQQMLGLKGIATAASTLFGINVASYDIFKGNSYSVGGVLTMEKAMEAVMKGVERGLSGEAYMFVAPAVWNKLAKEQNDLRNFDYSYDGVEAENGVEAIKYHYVNGTLKLFAHPLVKQGDGFIFGKETLSRIGSADLSFTVPGSKDGQIIFHDTVKNRYIMRMYGNQALFTDKPSQIVYMSGITLS